MIHAFLTPLTDVGEWLASRRVRFTSEEKSGLRLRKRATRGFVGSVAKNKFLPMLGIESRPSSP